MTAAVRERATSTEFDFWMGKWNVRNRRLVRRLAGSDEWDEFDSKVAAPTLPGGARERGRVLHRLRRWLRRDVVPLLRPGDGRVVDLLGRHAATRAPRSARDRLLRRRRRRLRGRRHLRGPADPRALHVVGGHDRTPRWEQAFSADGGGTWETNWIMDFTRALEGGRVNALEHASVAADDRHAEKFAHAEPGLALGDTNLKWYDVAPDDAPVPLAIRAVARRCLRDAARSDELGTLGELGFVILHRCGEDFYFLLVCTWRNENELWETVWAKSGDSDVLFPPLADGRRASAHVLRMGARRRVSRAGGLDALSPLRARQIREGRVPARRLLGSRMMGERSRGARSSSSSASSAAGRGTGPGHARAGAVDGARALHELARRRRPHRPGRAARRRAGRIRRRLAVEETLRARFAEDPWARNGMLKVTNVERWTILLAPED